MVVRGTGYGSRMTTTPYEPPTDPEVAPAGDPSAAPVSPDDDPGTLIPEQEPGQAPAPGG